MLREQNLRLVKAHNACYILIKEKKVHPVSLMCCQHHATKFLKTCHLVEPMPTSCNPETARSALGPSATLPGRTALHFPFLSLQTTHPPLPSLQNLLCLQFNQKISRIPATQDEKHLNKPCTNTKISGAQKNVPTGKIKRSTFSAVCLRVESA